MRSSRIYSAGDNLSPDGAALAELDRSRIGTPRHFMVPGLPNRWLFSSLLTSGASSVTGPEGANCALMMSSIVSGSAGCFLPIFPVGSHPEASKSDLNCSKTVARCAICQAPHDIGLPPVGNLAVAAEGRQHLLMSKILAPRLELLSGATKSLAQQRPGFSERCAGGNS
jgi:hypothetical protein